MPTNRWSPSPLLYGGDGGYIAKFLPLPDKLLLRKRSSINAFFATLNSGVGLEHSRHRSPIHALIHLLSCLAA